ncbi:hypothetical protein [Weissella sp. LMG 11983]|uniref:hypothetical protein n=1 Tax=Weissella sp. LMG 11983 TaxID=2987700 RepID=UPI0021F89B9D|nr:hypothetical protein [Weissella sp. LMG 11983]MCW0926192.1 hypothetical protein [Weissella sp. LMG 11983]
MHKDAVDGHIVDAQGGFNPVNVPNLEANGYGIISVKDLAGHDLGDHLSNNVFTWDDVVKDSRADVTVTVTYGKVTKVIAPDFDFGKIQMGSPEFYGEKPKNVEKITGDLRVINSVNPDAKWYLKAKIENDFMPGTPSITLYNADQVKQYTRTIDSQSKDIYNSTDWNNAPDQPGVWVLIQGGMEAHMPEIAQLNTSNLQKANLDFSKNEQEFHGTITWQLDTVPVS